jgi:hypothetical protein
MEKLTPAGRVVKRIKDGETNFDSDYSHSVSPDSYSVMRVDDTKLFDDMTEEERIFFSSMEQGAPFRSLSLWTNTWAYIEVDSRSYWIPISTYNVWDSTLSWDPTFITFGDNREYVLNAEEGKVYKAN